MKMQIKLLMKLLKNSRIVLDLIYLAKIYK